MVGAGSSEALTCASGGGGDTLRRDQLKPTESAPFFARQVPTFVTDTSRGGCDGTKTARRSLLEHRFRKRLRDSVLPLYFGS
jgi:hypothetical protein